MFEKIRDKLNQVAVNFLVGAVHQVSPPDPSQKTTQPLTETDPVIEAQVEELPDFGYHLSNADKIKAKFVDIVSLLVPFALAILLGVSNGFFFSGFRDFDTHDLPVVIAWSTGIIIELVALALVFVASSAKKAGETGKFVSSLSVALLLSSISLISQYGYLQQELANGAVHINDSTLNTIPVFSWFVGVGGAQGHDILFGLRSVSYHIAEFACSFFIVRTKVTAEKAIEIKRKEFDYKLTIDRNQASLDLMDAANKLTKTVMEQQQKQILLAMTQIQAQLQAPVFTEALPMPQSSQSQI